MLVAISGSQGCGKAQPIGSKVLTTLGWVNIEELNVGDTVITPDNKTSAVVGVFPQGIKPISLVVTHDGAMTRACTEHLWKISTSKQTKKHGKSVYVKYEDIITTSELSSLVDKVKRRRKSGQPETKKWGSNVTIPVPQPIDFRQHHALSVDPYVIGVMIGDGCVTQHQPIITSKDDDLIKMVETILIARYNQRLIRKNCKGNQTIDYVVGSSPPNSHTNQLRDDLEQLGMWGKYAHEKSIPTQYLTASIQNRIDLLCGLMDTDGTVSSTGSSVSYCTTSAQLAKDVQYLVRSLGGTATIMNRSPFYYKDGERVAGRVAYDIHINHTDVRQFFRLSRKKDRIKGSYFAGHKDGHISTNRRVIDVTPCGEAECFCIAIDHPDHLYITDDFVVTHNTTLINKLTDAGYNSITRKTSRSILTDWNVTLEEVNNNHDLTIRFQDEILKRKCEDDSSVANPPTIWITERTPIDLLVYSTVTLGMNNKFSSWLDEYGERCIEATNRIYGRIVFLTAGHFSIEHDGVRGHNKYYSMLVDAAMERFYKKLVNPSLLTVVDTPVLSDRINIIKQSLILPPTTTYNVASYTKEATEAWK